MVSHLVVTANILFKKVPVKLEHLLAMRCTPGQPKSFSILVPSSSFLTPYASSSVAACRRGAYGYVPLFSFLIPYASSSVAAYRRGAYGYVPLFSFLIPYASSSVAAYRRGAFGNVPSSLHPLISPFVQGNNPTQSPHSGNGLQ